MSVVAAAVVALTALAVAWGAGRHVYAALAGDAGLRAYEEARTLPAGGSRDQALHVAQKNLNTSISLAPSQPELWLALAEVRALQAHTPAGVLPELAQAAAVAAERAFALNPREPAAAARLAQVRALTGAGPAAVAEPVAQSYALDADNPDLAAWRPQVAFQAWPVLPLNARNAALTEACLYARETPQRFTALEAAAAGALDLDLRARLTGLLTDAACRPSPAAQDPDRAL